MQHFSKTLVTEICTEKTVLFLSKSGQIVGLYDVPTGKAILHPQKYATPYGFRFLGPNVFPVINDHYGVKLPSGGFLHRLSYVSEPAEGGNSNRHVHFSALSNPDDQQYRGMKFPYQFGVSYDYHYFSNSEGQHLEAIATLTHADSMHDMFPVALGAQFEIYTHTGSIDVTTPIGHGIAPLSIGQKTDYIPITFGKEFTIAIPNKPTLVCTVFDQSKTSGSQLSYVRFTRLTFRRYRATVSFFEPPAGKWTLTGSGNFCRYKVSFNWK